MRCPISVPGPRHETEVDDLGVAPHSRCPLLALAVTLAAPAPVTGAPPGGDHPRTLHVASSARAPGDGSVARPFPRISQAVGAAEAGTRSWSAGGGTRSW